MEYFLSSNEINKYKVTTFILKYFNILHTFFTLILKGD